MTEELQTPEAAPPRRVPFVVYDPATGTILRTGICAETDLHLQAHGTEAVIAGEADDERHAVRDGQIVDRAPVADPLDAQITARSTAAAYLASTDWMVIRAAEAGKPVPDDILQARAEARAVLSK